LIHILHLFQPLNSVHKTVLIWYSAQQMFELVSDVASYPQFLPWCDHARVLERHSDGQSAEIGIDFNGIKQRFATRNTHRQLDGGVWEDQLRLISGPFSQLEGHWRYTPVGHNNDACRVELQLQYDFDNAAIAMLVGPVFDWIASSLVDAFVKRAQTVYGSA
jgi:ribosome-associated toxin RatA of RatAB toxin-antitoxin module